MDIFCPACRRQHAGEIALDPTGWPRASWVEPHNPDDVELAHHRAEIANLAMEGFVLAASRSDFAAAETLLRELFEYVEEP